MGQSRKINDREPHAIASGNVDPPHPPAAANVLTGAWKCSELPRRTVPWRAPERRSRSGSTTAQVAIEAIRLMNAIRAVSRIGRQHQRGR